MPIAAIVIKENPVVTSVDFTDILKAGSENSWAEDSYGHEIRNIGGFWKNKFNLLPDKTGDITSLEEYLENGLGRNVDSYLPDGGALAWQGFISKMRLILPGAIVQVSLGDMANRVWVRYLSAEGGLIKRATKQNDTDSQTRFGIKEVVLQGAIISDANLADQAAAAYLNEYQDPRRTKTTVRLGGRASTQVRLEVFCEGYFKTMFWRTFNQTSTQGTQNANLQIQDIVDDGGQFIASTDLAINAIAVTQVYDEDSLAGDAVAGITRMGDSSNNRFIIGVYENRVLRYEQAKVLSTAADINYSLRIRDNRQIIKELGSGRLLNPAAIRPNNWLQTEDLFSTKISNEADINRDPKLTFIESVVYKEPIGLTLTSNRSTQADIIMAKAGFGGAAQL